MNATLSHDDNNDDDVSDGDNKIDDDGVDGECGGFDVDSPLDNLFQFCANLFHLVRRGGGKQSIGKKLFQFGQQQQYPQVCTCGKYDQILHE